MKRFMESVEKATGGIPETTVASCEPIIAKLPGVAAPEAAAATAPQPVAPE